MGSTDHVEDGTKELVKDIRRLSRLNVRLVDSTSGGVSVDPSFGSSIVVEVKESQHLHLVLMELKDSVLVKMNKSFSLGDDSIHRYQDRLCVPYVDDLRTRIIIKANGSRYSIHSRSTMMYHDLKQFYWCDGM